jgi:uncharacterized membrane protein YkoI
VLGALVLAGAGVLAAGCSASGAHQTGARAPQHPVEEQAAHAQATPSPSGSPGTRKAAVRVQDGVATALRKVPGIATDADLDKEHGKLAWEFVVLAKNDTWHRVDVDATSGKVLTSRTTTDHGDVTVADAKAAKITLTQAADTAEKQVTGKVTEATLDTHFNKQKRLNWEVDLRDDAGKKHEVVIDAATGKVISSMAKTKH